MQTALNTLAELGVATTDPVWLPVLTWTVLALPLCILLNRTDRLHPYAEYRILQVLLATLPLGIAGVGTAGMLPDATRSTMLPVQSVGILPTIEVTGGGAPSVTWMHAVGLITVVASGVGLLYLGRLALSLLAVVRVRRSVQTSSPPLLEVEGIRLMDRLNVRRPVQLCATPEATVPLTLGGPHPMILIPNQLTETTEELRMTLRHELVHIRRWDDIAQFTERLVSALFAAHPLVGRLHREIAAARERACDATVLDKGEASAGAYARLLAAFADGSVAYRPGALSLSESPSSLTDRLSAMRSSMPTVLSSRLTLGAVLLTVGLILTLGMIACSDTAIEPSPPPSPSGPETVSQSSMAAADSSVYTVVEDQPELKGGLKALQETVNYPERAKKAGIEGRVMVQFVVDRSGHVTDPTVIQGVHKLLNEAALAAVKQQTFRPGRTDGEAVAVQMVLPVTFRHDDESPERSDGTSGDAAGATSTSNSDDLLFEKAGIQNLRIRMNEEGTLLIDDEQIGIPTLTDAVQQRITENAARAALLYADGAPTDRVAAAEAKLRTLNLQRLDVRKGG